MNDKMKVLKLQELKQVNGGKGFKGGPAVAWSTFSGTCGGVGKSEWSTFSGSCRGGDAKKASA